MRLYNTLTKRFEELKLGKTVKMYVCGITAYDYSHIGHARTFVFFDVLRRYLEYKGHNVIYVQNFTDVDDKIVRRAVEEGKTQGEISRIFISEFLRDMSKLNVRRPNYMPKVTDHIRDIINYVERLIELGYAYEVEDEHGCDVYFHVPSFEGYGKLSGMSLDELNRHRIEPNPKKRDVKDFALWKSAKDEDFKANAVFDSPWGYGRPGWHIECSVLSSKYLGVPFEIHGGGRDLIFPHHENERAQSFAIFGVEPVKYWIHCDFVTIGGEKMSKSLGNIVRIRDFPDGEVLRYFLLTAFYRSPLDYSESSIERARRSYNYLRNTLLNLDMEISALRTFGIDRDGVGFDALRHLRDFELAMDSMNTPNALSIFHSLARDVNRNLYVMSLSELEECFRIFTTFSSILGLFEGYERIPTLPKDILELVKEREVARMEKDFERADRIREKLKERGIILIDTPKGTRWMTKHF
ncbi:MAG: cysteine--tRNA ligase [Archaeoglobales archaeon]|nr:MAG: cysteine--tRNA ligase [Archaeoglobales archaeon]